MRRKVMTPSSFLLLVLALCLRSGQAFLSHSKLSGQYVLRLVISQLRTEESHIHPFWQLARQTLKAVQAETTPGFEQRQG